jgi:D-xylose transport system permease protein
VKQPKAAPPAKGGAVRVHRQASHVEHPGETMASAAPGASSSAPSNEPAFRRLLRATEVDTRLLGMIGALLLIWLGFNVYTQIQTGEGLFLTPRNLWNLTVQTSSIAVMATGMVLVIVMRHIDLSVGSIVGFVSTIVGVAQVRVLPIYLGLDSPAIWILAVLIALAIGAAIGALHGSLVAYVGIPAFIVTLGGQLFWRGAAWWVTTGQTIAPLDDRFSLMGGGPYGSIGALWSWVLAAIACVAIVVSLYLGRQRRARFRFPQRPMWAEYVIAAVGCLLAIGATAIVNAYPWPERVAAKYAQEHNIPVPDSGLFISTGYAIPVLIALAMGVVMTFLARRTRFGRYVYAIGGNPEAAELAGINTRKITVMVFALMGALAAISACISSARLNSATNVLGQFDELYVIAAAVIGGTSLAGGVGTIYGALIGAVVIQSLQSGMVLLGFDSAFQQMVVGVVLVGAVGLDTFYRRRTAKG